MEYVLDENGNIKIGPNGKPLVKGADGKEFEIDAIGAQDKINTITTESNKRRQDLGEANTKLEAYGDLDPTVARKAMEDVAGMSDKNKTDMDSQRDAINKTWETKQATWDAEKATLNNDLYTATTGSQFATSKVIKTLIYPPGAAAVLYGKHFPVGKSPQFEEGKPIYSLENPGSPASFDEAMTQIIAADPNKDSILRSSEAEGGDGHKGGDGGGGTVDKSAHQNISEGLKARGIAA